MKLPAVLTAVNLQHRENVTSLALSIQHRVLLKGSRELKCSYFVVLANDYVVCVKKVRDVLLDHVVT